MAESTHTRAKAAHVNMMTDTVIKTLPADGLRVIVRSLLATHPEITRTFEAETCRYVQEIALPAATRSIAKADTQWPESTRNTIRYMVGCGLCYQALPLAGELIKKTLGLSLQGSEDEKSWASDSLASIDGDIVQAITAVQKTLLAPSGVRNPTEEERRLIRDLHEVLADGRQSTTHASIEYPYSRAFAATSSLLGLPVEQNREQATDPGETGEAPLSSPETFTLNNLLQFHWQFYNDPQYLDALRYLADDERVGALGLCNFDTEHMENVIQNGVTICSNQVQFSLIDSRPMVRMGELCQKHNIKLLTYGTLCGGFLGEKWLGRAEPDLYDEAITPSQRKYHGMIRSWGNWALFQELLTTLKAIGTKHKVSISNVATRWVLDFPYVGAVIVGARMGISEHTEENIASLGWSLDDEDQDAIELLLQKSKRHELFETMGDCGGEYR
ncbi:uncharacterized protein PG998_007493 [Apiospora kogelbergensis]|uniref:uncharacterized protein n=1 Tax=Apiospora kogelbergensis TaxID=1337665 RepID=UPI00312D5950